MTFAPSAEWLRTTADSWRSDALEHEARANEIEALGRNVGEPTAATRETVLRAIRAKTATDWLGKRGSSIVVTLNDEGEFVGSPLVAEGATLTEAIADLVNRAAIHERERAALCRRQAALTDAELAELTNDSHAA